eukprot:SAG31_NODE_827_length_11749_cov_14.363090_13_plen_109_part_00
MQLYVKFAVTDLQIDFPVMLTLIECAFAYVVLRAYTGSNLYIHELGEGWPIKVRWTDWRQAGPIALCAVFYAAQSSLEKASLAIVSVSFAQIVKASVPALVFLLGARP